MPKPAQPENLRLFAQLLRAYLTKTIRKQVELARASNWSESMLSKVLKQQATPNLAVFYRFQAPFLVAHGGLTHARQVIEMAALLDGELDEADLVAVANAVEKFRDPEQDTLYFRDRAEAFRQTIPDAFHAAESSTEASAEPAVVEIGDDPVATPTPDELPGQPPASAADAIPAAIAEWGAVLRDLAHPKPDELLDPDEVIAAVLDWERPQADVSITEKVWNWLGSPAVVEKLRAPARLAFVLSRCQGQVTWNALEWQRLNHVTAETARRQAGQAQLSPTQLASFVVDLGRVAFEAIRADDGKTPDLAVSLAALARRLPIGQAADWGWLTGIAQAGPIRLCVSPEGVCRFADREEAEFLAAQYLLTTGDEETLLQIAHNCGRPFGLFTQAVRSLHFAHRDEAAGVLIGALLSVSEVIPLRYADAAYLLAACEAPASSRLGPLLEEVEERLCQSWLEVQSPAYRAYVTQAMRALDRVTFRQLVHQRLLSEWRAGYLDAPALHSLALLGGRGAVETLKRLAASPLPPADQGDQDRAGLIPWRAVLAAAYELPPTEAAVLLEVLALRKADYPELCAAVAALAEAGTIPALRALERLAAGATHPKVRHYAQTRIALMAGPARAVTIARELDADSQTAGDVIRLMGLVSQAKALLRRYTNEGAENPSPVLSRVLGRVWANLSLGDDARVEAALGLIAAQAWPAFEICLGTLPLADDPGHRPAALLHRLLPALASARAVPWLWAVLDKAATPGQQALLIRCLGRAGGMALDDRFEGLLADPSEAVAVAAVGALAESLGQSATERLALTAATDTRASVTMAALEGLASIGSEQALPYLREKLSTPEQHDDAVFQLARLRYPDAERLLADLALAARNDLAALYRLYLPALAISGGAAAVQAIYDILGPVPDDLSLSQVRGHLAPDTAVRARDVWSHLARAPAPAWRMTAAAVLAQDSSQVLLDRVVHMAMEDEDWKVRDFARRALRWGAPAITSEPVFEYVFAQLERQVVHVGRPDAFLLELTAWCLNGPSRHDQTLPWSMARRALGVLRYLLSLVHPAHELFTPLLGALAFPAAAEAADDLERLLNKAPDADTQGPILDTLVAMRPPRLLDVLIRLARSSRVQALRAKAENYIAASANVASLLRLPNHLTYVAYEVAIMRDIRFQRKGLRQVVIGANGAQQTLAATSLLRP
jgi:hypothetical protein